MLKPVCTAIQVAVQLVVPVAVPAPPLLFVQLTLVTPTLSDAVPCKVTEALPVVYTAPEVGAVIAIEGRTVSPPVPAPVPPVVPTPVTTRLTVSPLATKLTVVLTVVVVAGVKRTVTGWVAPAPESVKGLPETTVNGGVTAAVPDMVPADVLEIVKVRSAELPRLTLPKFTVPLGLTSKAARAAALAVGEQALSLPLVSIAVTATKYVVPATSPLSRRLTVWLDAGLDVGDATKIKAEPGQGDDPEP